MRRCAITPYEGNEPYIFVSYAHKDAEMVYPVMEELDRRGYRVWHDDGIAPGSEWPENIAQHLNGCSLTLAFISPNAVASDNCRREVTFALSKQKEFLAIILQPTEMSLGMELQLSAQQCIMKYSYTSEEAFLHKLCSCPGMDPCRSCDTSDKRAELTETYTKNHVVNGHAEEAEGQVKRSFSRKRSKSLSEGKAKPSKRRKVLALSGGCFAAVAIICVLFSLWSTVQITPGKKVSRGETHLRLSGEYVTQDTIQQINKLDDLSYLGLEDCTFEKGALSLLELSPQVKSLTITGCSGIDELGFLTKLEKVHTLTLENSGISDAILPALNMEGLNILNLSGNPELTDLTSFARNEHISKLNVSGTGISSLDSLPLSALQTIDFSNTDVSDVSLLADVVGLTEIYGGESMVRQIDVLAGMTTLTTLDFSGCEISDMDCVFSSLRLEELDLSNNDLTQIFPFQDCTVLRRVDLSQNQLIDISVLEKSAGILETLNLAHNPLTEDQLQFLLGSLNLTELCIDGLPLKTLDMLMNATEIKALSAMNCGLSDISGLSGCPKLNLLRLALNDITDVGPLRGLTEDYITVDLGYNPIEDVSELPQLRYRSLSIISNELELSTLPSLTGTTLALKYSEKMMDEAFNNDAFNWYNIIGCPKDTRVALEEALGSYSVRYLDSGEESIDQMTKDGLIFIAE